MSQLSSLLQHVVEDRGTLTQQQGCSVLREMLEGDASDIQIAALVTAIATRGPPSTNSPVLSRLCGR